MITVETLEDEIKPLHEPRKDKTVSNYKPLSREDIVDLLTIAQKFNDLKTVTDPKARQSITLNFTRAQIRTAMGIPGATYPDEIKGLAARRHGELMRLFIKHAHKGPTEPNIGWIMNLTR